jgi:ketosteroid isomerase-like protein
LRQERNFVMLATGGKMRRTSGSPLALLVIVLSAVLAWSQSPAKPQTAAHAGRKAEDFASAIQRIRETWVREFNSGHADSVAALYAQEAVLMRRNGSVHSRDSIQAELQRSISREAQNYVVKSLHAESSGDLGYDTGIYNEDFHSHEAEGNYLMVIKRINGEWKIVAHAAVPNPRQK